MTKVKVEKTETSTPVTYDGLGYTITKGANGWEVLKIDFMKDDYSKVNFSSVYSDADYGSVEEQFRILVAKNLFMERESN